MKTKFVKTVDNTQKQYASRPSLTLNNTSGRKVRLTNGFPGKGDFLFFLHHSLCKFLLVKGATFSKTFIARYAQISS